MILLFQKFLCFFALATYVSVHSCTSYLFLNHLTHFVNKLEKFFKWNS